MKTFQDLVSHLRTKGQNDSEILEMLLILNPSINFSIEESD